MELKRGFYFTFDSIIAGGITLVFIILISSFYIKEQSSIHLNYLSQDIIRLLGTVTVSEIDNNYIKSLINDGTILNLDNTILEQVGEFWADNDMVSASKTASNVTENWISNNTGFGIWMDNEIIYKRDIPIKKYLVSSKKMISGIRKGGTSSSPTRNKPPSLWGPAIAEVRAWE